MTFYDFYKKVQRAQEKFCNNIDDISDCEMENPNRKEVWRETKTWIF